MVAEQRPEQSSEKHIAQGMVLLPTWPGPCILHSGKGLPGVSRDGNWGQAEARSEQSHWLLFQSLLLQKGHAKSRGKLSQAGGR